MLLTDVRTYNLRKGAHVYISIITPIITVTNVTILAGSLILNVARPLGLQAAPQLKMLEYYNVPPIAILNAAFLILMNTGYDRYYDLYTRTSDTTRLGDLIDVSVKTVLFIGTFALLLFPTGTILLAFLGYTLDYLRIRELIRSVPDRSPLSNCLKRSLLPNNARHCRALAILSLLFICVAIGMDRAVAWILTTGDAQLLSTLQRDPKNSNEAFLVATFIIYWSWRSLDKRLAMPNPLLTSEGMRRLDEQMEEFFREQSGTQGQEPGPTTSERSGQERTQIATNDAEMQQATDTRRKGRGLEPALTDGEGSRPGCEITDIYTTKQQGSICDHDDSTQ